MKESKAKEVIMHTLLAVRADIKITDSIYNKLLNKKVI